MKISVTQEHIDWGKQCDSARCPISLAIRQQTKYNNAAVGLFDVALGGLYPYGVDLPVNAQQFVRSFDLKEEVKPFEFDLEILDED